MPRLNETFRPSRSSTSDRHSAIGAGSASVCFVGTDPFGGAQGKLRPSRHRLWDAD